MSLHDQIMNVGVQYNEGDFRNQNEYIRYKEGHRDARHSAAEVALKADARIEELE